MTEAVILFGYFLHKYVPPCVRPIVGGLPAHFSHHIYLFKGVYYCYVCGFYAGQRTQSLAKPCTKVRTKHGRAALADFSKSQLPARAAPAVVLKPVRASERFSNRRMLGQPYACDINEQSSNDDSSD